MLPNISNLLIKNSQNFNVRKTSNSKKIISDKYSFLQTIEPSTKQDLILMNLTYLDAKKWIFDTDDEKINTKLYMFNENAEMPIQYYAINPDLVDFNNKNIIGYKFDLNAAYWNVARQVFLSEKTYKMGIRLKKSKRLKALGSLATLYEYEQYENGIIMPNKYSERKDTAFAFFYISQIVGNIISTIYKNVIKNSFGFWADCVYCNSNDYKVILRMRKIAEKYGLEFSEERFEFCFKQDRDFLYIFDNTKNSYYLRFNKNDIYGYS